MSANKYANLPDIDTAPDIYETEDVFPSAHTNADSSDEDAALPTRRTVRTGEGAGREELDSSSLPGAEEAGRKFRRAERKRGHQRTHYTYPSRSPSPNRSRSRSRSRPRPLAHRLRALHAELTSLEAELADPSNPLLHDAKAAGEEADAGVLIRGLVDVRGRLEKIRSGKEGRGRLVGVLAGQDEVRAEEDGEHSREDGESEKKEAKITEKETKGREVPDVRSVVEMDKRVGELEKLIGSSSTALDETSPLPPPLLPLLTRLSTQLTLLTQPRHVDSISRRLKLLLSDLDRVSSAQQHSSSSSTAAHRRQASASSPHPSSTSQISDQLLPLLTRLSPTLPQIPHILTRLRTLSALHTSASAFASSLSSLEEEQRRVRAVLGELKGAVDGVERSLEENRAVVGGNVRGLEGRVDGVVRRLEGVGR